MKPPPRIAPWATTALATACALVSAHCCSEEPAPLVAFQSFARVGGFVVYNIEVSDGRWTTITTTTSTGQVSSFDQFFDSVTFGDTVHFQGAELMKQHVLLASSDANSWFRGWRADGNYGGLAIGAGDEVRATTLVAPTAEEVQADPDLKSARYSLYTTAGVRYLNTEDYFSFEGRGSILGRTSIETAIDHDLVGPQLGVGGVFETGVWRFEGLLGLIGHQRVEYYQRGIFGEENIPGAINRSATPRTTASPIQSAVDEEFAWNGELRLTTSCYVTPSLRADIGWRGVVTSGIRDASATTAWNAPNFGLNVSDGDAEAYDYWVLSLTHNF